MSSETHIKVVDGMSSFQLTSCPFWTTSRWGCTNYRVALAKRTSIA